jgi:hypothetical protein
MDFPKAIRPNRIAICAIGKWHKPSAPPCSSTCGQWIYTHTVAQLAGQDRRARAIGTDFPSELLLRAK